MLLFALTKPMMSIGLAIVMRGSGVAGLMFGIQWYSWIVSHHDAKKIANESTTAMIRTPGRCLTLNQTTSAACSPAKAAIGSHQ